MILLASLGMAAVVSVAHDPHGCPERWHDVREICQCERYESRAWSQPFYYRPLPYQVWRRPGRPHPRPRPPVVYVQGPPVYVDAPPVYLEPAQIYVERPEIIVRPSQVIVASPEVHFEPCEGGVCPPGAP